jgi:NADPH:quinone reductase-like Zn-dependent oxidoreductase
MAGKTFLCCFISLLLLTTFSTSSSSPLPLPLPLLLLQGKRVLVTGGGRGIGKAIALICHQVGAQVAIISSRTESVGIARDFENRSSRSRNK